MKVPAWLDGWRCPNGHLFLYPHEKCPRCSLALTPTRLGAKARLRSATTVRVNPSGAPFQLGIAVTDEGASTLCIVEGTVRGNGRDRVVLVKTDERFVARGRGWRTTGNNRAQDATPEDSRKS